MLFTVHVQKAVTGLQWRTDRPDAACRPRCPFSPSYTECLKLRTVVWQGCRRAMIPGLDFPCTIPVGPSDNGHRWESQYHQATPHTQTYSQLRLTTAVKTTKQHHRPQIPDHYASRNASTAITPRVILGFFIQHGWHTALIIMKYGSFTVLHAKFYDNRRIF